MILIILNVLFSLRLLIVKDLKSFIQECGRKYPRLKKANENIYRAEHRTGKGENERKIGQI